MAGSSVSSSSSFRTHRNWIGKYRLLAELGQGGMGDVYLAAMQGPVGFNKLVVLKMLRPQLAREQSVLGMFLDEARLAARLSHPNVVQTYEIAEIEGEHIIVMEYLEGQSLSNVTARATASEPFTRPSYLRVLADSLAGLHYAHELADYNREPLGLIHRDVSPQNILVTYDGQVKLLDFGIAKCARSSVKTETGILRGKVAHMAPEQMFGEPMDRRADIFAVGTMLWECATGKKLWAGMNEATIVQAVSRREIPNPRSVDPDVPKALEEVCMRALALDPKDRYPDAASLREELEVLLDQAGRISGGGLARYLTKVFEGDRAEIRAIIERQLSSASGTIAHISVRPPALAAPVESEQRAIVARDPSAVDTAAERAFPGVAPAPRPPRRTMGWAALAVALGGGLLYAITQLPRREAPIATASARQEVAPSPPPSAAAPKPSKVKLHVSATPSHAQMFLDDVALDGNPHSREVEQDALPHRLRAQAPGYATQDVVVRMDHDLDMALILDETRTVAPAVSSAPRAPARPPSRGAPAGTRPSDRPTSPKPSHSIDKNIQWE